MYIEIRENYKFQLYICISKIMPEKKTMELGVNFNEFSSSFWPSGYRTCGLQWPSPVNKL